MGVGLGGVGLGGMGVGVGVRRWRGVGVLVSLFHSCNHTNISLSTTDHAA